MKHFKHTIIIVLLFIVSCDDFLNVEPTDRVTKEALFSSKEGIDAYLANLYYQLPIEDFRSDSRAGFNYVGNNVGMYPICIGDDGINSEYNDSPEVAYPWWDQGYRLNRDINAFFSYIPDLTIDEETKRELLGQAYFMRAYTYFALAKRYGGVPIITAVADISDSTKLYVPRSTEKHGILFC